tara:strand:+ start:425 stop:634 length:210 start_codon:yes stop_codon:yes gene_type:complete
MTYKQLLEELKKLTPEQLERRVVLYDTLSGHLYDPETTTVKEVMKRKEEEVYEDRNLPVLDKDVVVISF